MSDLETTIELVVVYTDRALVRRAGEIELAVGAQLVEISGLPLTMDPDSVRVSAARAVVEKSQARARLMGVQIKPEFFNQAPVEQVRQLEKQVEAAQDELADLDRRLELVKLGRQQLAGLMGESEVFAKALASGEMDVELQMKMLASLQKHAGDMDTQLTGLQGERRGIERRLDQLKKQLDQVHSTRPPERLKAVVELEVTEGGGFGFLLSYTVAKAGWKPLYDLRLVEAEGASVLETGYLAQVTQSSGEDWGGVELWLSTARPALAATLPELKPWFIQPWTPAPSPRPSPRSMAAAPLRMDSISAAKAVEETVEEVTAEVDSTGAAITFRIPGKTTIPSDGSPHKVTVARIPLAPTLDYASAPKLVAAVYRRAKVVNDSPFLLLPGKASLFSGEEFIGATALELTAPQGEIELYLGVEDRLKVERELTRREVEKSLVGGKRRVHFSYEIKLENLLPAAVSLTVHDQMPVGKHEDIRVRLEGADPRPQEPGELNRLDWVLTLAPKEKKSIRFGFMVEYPQDMQVVGLP